MDARAHTRMCAHTEDAAGERTTEDQVLIQLELFKKKIILKNKRWLQQDSRRNMLKIYLKVQWVKFGLLYDFYIAKSVIYCP